MKESNTNATVSVRFSVEGHDEDYLTIGGMLLDLTDIASPVRSLKADGQEIIRGPIFDVIAREALDGFITIQENANGLYIIDEEKITKG
jgi:hypothetical protein